MNALYSTSFTSDQVYIVDASFSLTSKTMDSVRSDLLRDTIRKLKQEIAALGASVANWMKTQAEIRSHSKKAASLFNQKIEVLEGLLESEVKVLVESVRELKDLLQSLHTINQQESGISIAAFIETNQGEAIDLKKRQYSLNDILASIRHERMLQYTKMLDYLRQTVVPLDGKLEKFSVNELKVLQLRRLWDELRAMPEFASLPPFAPDGSGCAEEFTRVIGEWPEFKMDP